MVGALYGGGLYLVMRRSIVKLLIGLALLSHAGNLLIFTSAGLTRAHAPLVAEHASPKNAAPSGNEDSVVVPEQTEGLQETDAASGRIPPLTTTPAADSPRIIADPLPQALILTAIVISFGVLAFALVLMLRAFQTVGTDDVDQLNTTDREAPLSGKTPTH